MRMVKKILLIICIVVLINASFVYAIEFDTETIYNSIFVIYSGEALGSGFAIGENCIITNAHVIEQNNSIIVTTYAGKQYDAFVIAMDSNLDIAVLGVKNVSFTPLAIANDSSIIVGEDVYAIGAPNSMAYTLTKGVISAKNRQVKGQSYIQTDAAINKGNSGGPLLNSKGEVVGVNSYKISNNEGIGLAIPISRVSEFINSKNIETNDSGNVSNIIQPQDGEQNEDTDIVKNETEDNKQNIILIVCLIISVLLNIILTIILLFNKRKNLDSKIQPSERTDFEIDLIE